MESDEDPIGAKSAGGALEIYRQDNRGGAQGGDVDRGGGDCPGCGGVGRAAIDEARGLVPRGPAAVAWAVREDAEDAVGVIGDAVEA